MSRRKQPRRGSGASRRTQRVRDVFVARPFEGLAGEAEWVALRELVPAATFPMRLNAGYGDREITFSTVLPMAWPALVRADGQIMIGLQRTSQSGDVSRDLAASVLIALESEPGQPVDVPGHSGPGPRLQDVLEAGVPPEITIRDGFDYWLDESPAIPQVRASLEQANASVFPTERMRAAPAAYWCRFSDKAHVRWVLPQDEETALRALARLAARSQLGLGETEEATRFAGMLRAHGLLVPVWDLPPDLPASRWEQPLARVAGRYAEALADSTDPGQAERRARDGLRSRQVTVR